MIRTATKPEPNEKSSIWIVMIERGLSKEEVAQLDLWLLSDPENGQRLLDMAAVWDELAVLAEPQKRHLSTRIGPIRVGHEMAFLTEG